jgi:hypothetical protein
MGKPYVYVSGAKFPSGKRARVVKLNAIVSNQDIARTVFSDDEWAWVQGFYTDLLADPSRWVAVGIELIKTRSAGLNVTGTTKTQQGFLGMRTVTRAYPYTAEFLALYQVLRSVFLRCIEPNNRPRFAQELRAKPYEAEILRTNPYTDSVIAGVLAENPGPSEPAATGGSAPTIVLIQCAHCRRTYEYTSISCPWCGAPR